MAAQQTIVVDHLARLDDGSIVIAGIDGNHEHIAPLRGTPWDTAATTRAGGPFGIGQVVDLGFSRRSGTPPLVEARVVEEESVNPLGRLPDGEDTAREETATDEDEMIDDDDTAETQQKLAAVPEDVGNQTRDRRHSSGSSLTWRRESQLNRS